MYLIYHLDLLQLLCIIFEGEKKRETKKDIVHQLFNDIYFYWSQEKKKDPSQLNKSASETLPSVLAS